MPVRLVFLIVLLVAGVVVLLLRRRPEGEEKSRFSFLRRLGASARGSDERREEIKALPAPSKATSTLEAAPDSGEATDDGTSPPQERDASDGRVVHVAEVLDGDLAEGDLDDRDPKDGDRTSSTPPIPLLTPRSSKPSRGGHNLPGRAALPRDAGRYSLSSYSREAVPQELEGPAIPKAPPVPREAEAAGEVAPPTSESPSSPSSAPRTQRGLGRPTPPTQRPRADSGSSWRTTTVSGLGSFGRHRGPGASTTPPDDRPPEEAPSSPKPPKGAPATPLVVERIRASSLPPPRWKEALGPACDDLLRRTTRSPRVVLLTAPEPAGASLAEVAVELAARLAPVVGGGVALVETDFERPRLRQLFGFEVPFGKGLSEQLHASVRAPGSAPWAVLDAELGFHLLVEGRIRSPGLLWSQGFPEIVKVIGSKYRLVLLVAPSHLTSVDRQALDDVCDDVIVVSGEGETPKGDLHLGSGVLADKVVRTVHLLAEA